MYGLLPCGIYCHRPRLTTFCNNVKVPIDYILSYEYLFIFVTVFLLFSQNAKNRP